MIDCYDGMVVAHTAGTSPNAEPARHDAGTGPQPRCVPASVPRSHGDRGCHYRWPGWLERMGRHGLVRSMSAKGCSPDNAAAEGFFGRMKVESVHLRALGGAYVRGGRRPRRRVHPLVQPYEDQTVAGMEKPGRIQNKPGAGRIGKQLQENVRSPLSKISQFLPKKQSILPYFLNSPRAILMV